MMTAGGAGNDDDDEEEEDDDDNDDDGNDGLLDITKYRDWFSGAFQLFSGQNCRSPSKSQTCAYVYQSRYLGTNCNAVWN